MVVRVTWVVRLVLVIEFVNANGSHGLNNQIIEKTCDFTPVTETHTHTWESGAVFCLGRIRDIVFPYFGRWVLSCFSADQQEEKVQGRGCAAEQKMIANRKKIET